MQQEKIIKTLCQKLQIRGEQSKIALAIGVSKSTVKRWTEDKEITPAHSKLLALYFYGELPFEMLRPAEDLSTALKFTGTEWRVITTLATREGYTSPQAWITAQIRGYLRNITTNTPELKVAEDEAPYTTNRQPTNNIVDPSTEENDNGGNNKQA